MKQVLNQRGKILVEEVPSPSVEPGRLLVSTHHSCISTGTELSGLRSSATPLWRKALQKPEHVQKVVNIALQQGVGAAFAAVRDKIGTPLPLGYSAAGKVLAVGEGITQFSVGDLVACAGAQCAHHAEVLSIPQNLAVHIPANVGTKEASTVAIGAIALQGVRRLEPSLGEKIVVLGLGIIGQISVQILKASGCKTMALDLSEARLQLALKNGLDHKLPTGEKLEAAVLQLTQGMGADAVLITASGSDPSLLSLAFRLCRKRGRVVLVGDVPLQFQREDLYEKELDFRISTSYGPGRYDYAFEEKGIDYPLPYVRWTETRNMEAYLDLIQSKKVQLGTLLGESFPIEKAAEAFASLQNSLSLASTFSYGEQENLKTTIKTPLSVALAQSSRAPLRLAVIGAGSFVENVHLPNLLQLKEQFSLHSVVNRTPHKAHALQKRFGFQECGTEWQKALQDPATDAVLIGTRHDQHANMAIAALQAGKHVLLEKPIALNAAELEAIRVVYEGLAKKPLFFTGYNRRFSPSVWELKQKLAQARGPVMLSYQMNAGYLPHNHWVHGAEGGGRNIGEACHIYDLFVALLGEPQMQSIRVNALHAPQSMFGKNDNFSVSLSFKNGSVANLLYTACGNSFYPKEHLTAYFDQNIFQIHDYKHSVFISSNGKKEEKNQDSKGHKEELLAFAKACQEGKEAPGFGFTQQCLSAEISYVVENLFGNS